MVGREPELEEEYDFANGDFSHGWIESFDEVEPERKNAPSSTGSYHLRKFTGDDYSDHLVMPLIQVFRVDIVPNFGDGKPCEIYGSIQVFEGTRYSSHIYRRDRDDFEKIENEEGTLSLVGPSDAPIFPTMTTSLNFCLEDKIRGVKVVDGKLDLNPGDDDSYDRLLTDSVPGPHGFARVHYVVFRSAHLGTVDVEVAKTENDDKGSNGMDICGSIVAGYANDKWLETQLFDRPLHKPLCVVAGTSIRLSRNVVVVPLYSTLEIKVNLCDSNQKSIVGSLQYPAHQYDRFPQYIQTQDARVEVGVQWNHAYFHRYKDQIEECHKVESSKELSTIVPKIYIGYERVEIFSIFVGGIAEKISSLCGAVLINDGSQTFSIYNRDDCDSEVLPSTGLASIDVNHRSIRNAAFQMDLYLKDPLRNLEVTKGSIIWCLGTIGRQPGFSWYTKRICSLVRGDDGFAVVHYSMFYNAYEASVKAKLKLTANGHSGVDLPLHGTLFARYGSYEYSANYDKKYYQSRLLDRAEDRYVQVNVGSEIPLLKSIVVGPFGSSLLIEANLKVGEETISGVTEFYSTNLSRTELKMSEKISGIEYEIELSVSMKRV